MFKSLYGYVLIILLLALGSLHAQAQDPTRMMRGMGGRFRSMGGSQQGGGGDSLEHRTGLEDSITISFRYLDSSRYQKFDSSVQDFTLRFPIGWSQVGLGNLGNATHDLLFMPRMRSGWDHGFHSFDTYNFTLDQTRFYTTTRPYSEIGYLLGSKAEQMVHLLHTQNIKPNWNASFQYRMINSPGTFQSQNTNLNHYRFTSWYQGKRKRYQNFLVILGNKMASAENGGILQDENYLTDPSFQDNQYKIPVQLGNGSSLNRNFFSSNIGTGSFYTNATYFMRQQYDVGQSDSLVVNDTTVIPLFYPRLRFEHNISYRTFNYRFRDEFPDSAYYASHYDGQPVRPDSGSVFRQDYWKELLNDFSIYQFPDAHNPQQFIKVGIAYQMLRGRFDTTVSKGKYDNLFLHGEYRNQTRNKKWDIEAYGNFYMPGYNGGDYDAHIRLKRMISKKIGYFEAGFENTSRRPSFIFDPASSFYVDQPADLNKENTTRIFASIDQPAHHLELTGNYYLLSNYTYLADYYHVRQAGALFNVVQVQAKKEFPLGKHWKWRTWVILQKKTGTAELNMPLLFTRNQLAYDGNLGFRNLRISFGGEFRYFTPYKADGYSPVLGQFYYQDSSQVNMRLPDIAAYVHFRIRSFVAYVRAENLNSFNPTAGNFTRNNVLIPGYPSPGLQIRVGIFWSFVN